LSEICVTRIIKITFQVTVNNVRDAFLRFLHISTHIFLGLLSWGSAEADISWGEKLIDHLVASCVKNIHTKNCENVIIFVQVRVENVRNVFFETQCTYIMYVRTASRGPDKYISALKRASDPLPVSHGNRVFGVGRSNGNVTNNGQTRDPNTYEAAYLYNLSRETYSMSSLITNRKPHVPSPLVTWPSISLTKPWPTQCHSYCYKQHLLSDGVSAVVCVSASAVCLPPTLSAKMP